MRLQTYLVEKNQLGLQRGSGLEIAVEKAIKLLKPEWKVDRSTNRNEADIKINGKHWIEVKTTSGDIAGGNTSFEYRNGKWSTDSKLKPMHQFGALFTQDARAQQFIEDLRKFIGGKDPIIGKGAENRKNGYLMEFIESRNYKGGREVTKLINVDIFAVMKENYALKNCYYLQMSDNFFRFSNENPLNFKADIPIITKGIGDMRLRWDKDGSFMRSEPKILQWTPNSSPYSFIESNGQPVKDPKRIPY